MKVKDGVRSVYKHWSVQHIHRYLTEYQTRGNMRDFDTIDQIALTIRAMVNKRLPYDELIGKRPPTEVDVLPFQLPMNLGVSPISLDAAA